MGKNHSPSASASTTLTSLSPSIPVTEPPLPPPPPPPSQPIVDQPDLSGEEEKPLTLKTPEKILTDNDTSGGSLPPPPPPQMIDGAIATAVGGGASVMDGDIIGPVKRRKPSDIKDPPSGTPTCPICSKTFWSWKGAFGHMRKHPERQYRGFFKPPTFSSSSSKAATNATGNGHDAAGEGGSSSAASGEVGEGEAPPAVHNLFDLNQPAEGVIVEERKIILGFDLNEPADEEEEEEEKKEVKC